MKTQKRPSYMTASLAAAFVMLAMTIPFITGLFISLMDYTARSQSVSITGGAWIGLSNYIALFTSEYLVRAVKNSVILTVIPAAMTSVIAALLVYAIVRLPSRYIKRVALCIAAIPAFIPIPYQAGIFIELCSSDGILANALVNLGVLDSKRNLLAVPELFPFVYTAFDTLRFLFFPVVVGVAAVENNKYLQYKRILTVAVSYFLVRLTLLSVIDTQYQSMLYNPITYQTADTLGTYAYRTGVQIADYSYAAAMDVVRFIIAFSISFPAYRWILSKDRVIIIQARNTADEADEVKYNRVTSICAILGTVILLSGILAFAVFTVWNTANGFIQTRDAFNAAGVSFSDYLHSEYSDGSSAFIRGLLNSLFYAGIAALLVPLFSVLLAYPLQAKKRWYPVFIIALLSMGRITAADNFLLEYFKLENIRLLAVFLCSTPVFCALALGKYMAGVRAEGFILYLRKAAPALIVLAAIGFIGSWISWREFSFIFSQRELYPLSQLIYEWMVESDCLLYGVIDSTGKTILSSYQCYTDVVSFISSLPPLVVGWIVIWFERKLPIALLGSGVRK